MCRATPGFIFPRWFKPSLLSLCLNLPLALSGLPFSSFDAYTHVFFADHYRRSWFDLLEPRWFGGFSVASYPPLTHQLVALLSLPASAVASVFGGEPNEIRFRGEAVGYCLLLLIVLALLPVAAEHFAAIFVPARAARTAGWLAVGLPSIYLTAYSFGQLPTLAATTALMFALAEGWRYCDTGRWRKLISAMTWAGVTAAAHHAVLLFALAAGAAIAGRSLLWWESFTAKPRHRLTVVSRLIIWAVSAGAFGALVIWPFIAWSRGYLPQTPIDHASRHNYLTDWLSAYYFFWPMYGPYLLTLPLSLFFLFPLRRLQLSWRKRRHWPLLGAAILLFALGLGGTTPLPQWLFGSNWAWLTYDRFSLWAGLALLPFAGLLYQLYRPRFPFKTLTLALIPFCLYAAFAARWVKSQPPPVDLEAIARFLNTHASNGERYLTFGFGDQLARLSVLADARTVDGTYFTARMIPKLRQSGLGTLDGAVWNPAGAEGIAPFLAWGQAWGVRWVFNMHPAYIAPLIKSGWQLAGVAAPGVQVWRNPAPWVSTEWRAPVNVQPGAGVWWGIAPLATLTMAVLMMICNRTHAAHGSAFILALAIVAWPFWHYSPIWSKPVPGVYFTYTSGLAFLADWLIGALAILMLLNRQRPDRATALPSLPLFLASLLYLALIFFALLSIPDSVEPLLSSGFTAHLMLLGIAAWAVSQTMRAIGWRPVAYALTAGLILQSVIAVMEFATQTTAWLDPLGMAWPGRLEAAMRGASVIGLPDGARWLRAYGTLPHPNLLAGYLIVTLAGPLMGYIQTGRWRWLWPLALGAGALCLTFSRAGWLAGGALAASAMLLLPPQSRRRAITAVAALGLVGVALVAALGPLFFTRATASGGSPEESFSITDRAALIEAAIMLIKWNPINGVGAGAFLPTLVSISTLTPEPVHNVLLLATAETGLGGGLAALALGGVILWEAWRRRGQVVVAILSAVIVGLMVMATFDHFLWSLSAGRMLAAVVMGIWWGGQTSQVSKNL